MEFTSLQKNQQLQQKTSHNIVKICFKQPAVHQPEEQCSRPLSCSETEEKWVSQTSQHLHVSAVTPYQISCQHTSFRSMSPSRNSETVVLSYSTAVWPLINQQLGGIYTPWELPLNWRSFADNSLLQDVCNAQESFPTLLVVWIVVIVHSTQGD